MALVSAAEHTKCAWQFIKKKEELHKFTRPVQQVTPINKTLDQTKSSKKVQPIPRTKVMSTLGLVTSLCARTFPNSTYKTIFLNNKQPKSKRKKEKLQISGGECLIC